MTVYEFRSAVEQQTIVLQSIRALVCVVADALDHAPSEVTGDALFPVVLSLDRVVESLEECCNRCCGEGSCVQKPYIPVELGTRDWLISIRKERGFSQKDVAMQIGVAQASYCTIEKGKTNPSVGTAKAIGSLLGFDWTKFYEEA